MFNNYIPSNYYTPQDSNSAQGALEIALRARAQEKKLALRNSVSQAEAPIQRKAHYNPIRTLLVSFFALVR